MTSETKATKFAAGSPRLSAAAEAEEEPTLASASSSSSASAFADVKEDECVGNSLRMGDLVWGKVESHPWWPGVIYEEDFASESVLMGWRRDHVLVAFFGDGSYGWFHPDELIPFEENFAVKSRQASSEEFVAAVEEAVDELGRRRSLGLACRCRNEFNFSPAKVKGYSYVDVGDSEPWFYSASQIKKARDGFKPTEMVSFLKVLALDPMRAEHGTVGLIEKRATVLACRKALYEEFDETYAQAFGSVPVRPPRPTAPVALDPSKAPLSGRLVIAEALGKDERSVKPTKNMERDRHLSKLREEAIQMKRKKATYHPVLVYGSGYSKKAMYRHQPMGPQASISIGRKPHVSSLRHDDPTKGGKKRSLSDRPEFIKKKSLEDLKKRKIDGSWDSKKKNVDCPKPPVAVKNNILHRPSSEREGTSTANKDFSSTARKVAKLKSSKKKTEDVRKKLNPTMLFMKFPAGVALPSGPQVQAKFARFGPLDHTAMRIFWKTHTVKLVYLHRTDAQEALKFATRSENLFGCSDLRCHIRELEVDPTETSKKKAGGGCAEVTLKIADPTRQHPPPQPVNLKPCLKKSSGGEGGNGGGGRSTRVKFVLGGEDEALLNEKKNSLQNIAPSKMLPKLIDPNLQKVPVNMASSSSSMQGHRLTPTPAEEFSREMIALLTRCRDVVSDVVSVLGCKPYHPL